MRVLFVSMVFPGRGDVVGLADWQILLFRLYAMANAAFFWLLLGGIIVRLLYRIAKALERVADQLEKRGNGGDDP